MSCISRLFKPNKSSKVISNPDTGHLDKLIREAKEVNSREVDKFVEASRKHERNAKLARLTVSRVLERVDNLKATKDDRVKE